MADARRTLRARAASSALLAIACACASPDSREDGRETTASSVTAEAEPNPVTQTNSGGEPVRAEAREERPPAPPLPRLASGEMPVYPRASRRLGEEGWVEVVVDVREDGEVLGFAIADSSGSPRLDEAVLAAARTWRFLPRTGSRGVDHMRHRIVFQLTRK